MAFAVSMPCTATIARILQGRDAMPLKILVYSDYV